MAEVARLRTPLSEQEIADALISGHKQVFGCAPSTLKLGCACCHIDIENEHGKSIWDNNFGNITGGDQFYTFVTKEQTSPGVWKELKLHYRAYPDAVSGAAGYWKLLASDHYSLVLEFFEAGDIEGATRELGRQHYYTANIEPYVHTMVQLFDAWKKQHGVVEDDDPYASEEP